MMAVRDILRLGVWLVLIAWPLPTLAVPAQEGVLSYYADSLHGRRTASGQRYSKHAMTAAHRTLAFGTRVRVTNLLNGKSVVVTINDRGPFVRGRILDLSRTAATQLDMIEGGLVRGRIEVIGGD